MEIFFGTARKSNLDQNWSLEFKVVQNMPDKVTLRVYFYYNNHIVGAAEVPENLLDILVEKRAPWWAKKPDNGKNGKNQ